MKAIKCELCGSTDVVKSEGVYQCAHCKAKYTVEEATKLLTEVKIDRSEEYDNYLSLARRAKGDRNAEEAEKYYDLVLRIEPDNWEAMFFQTYFSAMKTNIAGISNAIQKVTNSISSVFETISRTVNPDDIKPVLAEICNNIIVFGNMCMSALKNHFIQYHSVASASDQFSDGTTLLTALGISSSESLQKHIANDEIVKEYALILLKFSMYVTKEVYSTFLAITNGTVLPSMVEGYNMGTRLVEKYIRKYEPDYTVPELVNRTSSGKKEGCYIATCVYGSYDHPRVLILRQFRDNYLAKSHLGKAFISVYYMISPKVVGLLGSNSYFTRITRFILNRCTESHLHLNKMQ